MHQEDERIQHLMQAGTVATEQEASSEATNQQDIQPYHHEQHMHVLEDEWNRQCQETAVLTEEGEWRPVMVEQIPMLQPADEVEEEEDMQLRSILEVE